MQLFFVFPLEAYHEQLNVREELLLFTLAVDEDKFAGIDREMRRRKDVEPPYVCCAFRSEQDSDSECQVTDDSVFCKEETSTAIGMIKEKKKDRCAKENKSKDTGINLLRCLPTKNGAQYLRDR